MCRLYLLRLLHHLLAVPQFPLGSQDLQEVVACAPEIGVPVKKENKKRHCEYSVTKAKVKIGGYDVLLEEIFLLQMALLEEKL